MAALAVLIMPRAARPLSLERMKFGDILTRRNLFREVVPADRTCADAGVEPYLCACDNLTPCSMPEDAPAVAFQARVALAVLNARLLAMLQARRTRAFYAGGTAAQGKIAPCASSLELVRATGARTSDAPPSLEFALTVRAGRREARFFVSMACLSNLEGSLRGGAMKGSSYAATGESAMRATQHRFVPPRSTACALTSLIRLSSMSGAEDEVYKTPFLKDGKLCVIE